VPTAGITFFIPAQSFLPLRRIVLKKSCLAWAGILFLKLNWSNLQASLLEVSCSCFQKDFGVKVIFTVNPETNLCQIFGVVYGYSNCWLKE
jgi:hypothetical protein